MKSCWESAKIFVRLQWVDRANTSSFLIGLSIQTGVLCLSVWDKSLNAEQAFTLAARASFLTIVGITLFAAMSSLANDIRLGTFSYLILSREHLFVIVFKRCLANTVVSFSTVVLPFAAAGLKFPELLPLLPLALALVFITVTLTGFQVALIVNSFRHPARGVPWLRYLYLMIGLNLLPFSPLEKLSQALPFYWILRLSQVHGPDLAASAMVALSLGFAWTVIAWALCSRRMLKSVESLQQNSKLRVA